jgi:hypothetical protein
MRERNPPLSPSHSHTHTHTLTQTLSPSLFRSRLCHLCWAVWRAGNGSCPSLGLVHRYCMVALQHLQGGLPRLRLHAVRRRWRPVRAVRGRGGAEPGRRRGRRARSRVGPLKRDDAREQDQRERRRDEDGPERRVSVNPSCTSLLRLPPSPYSLSRASPSALPLTLLPLPPLPSCASAPLLRRAAIREEAPFLSEFELQVLINSAFPPGMFALSAWRRECVCG